MRAILLADLHHRNFIHDDFFGVYSDYVLEQLGEMVELEPQPVFLHEFEEKKEILEKAEIIFSNWGMPELPLSVIQENLPNIKAVFYAGGVIHAFATPYFQLGARVFSTGLTNAVPASEYTLANILLAAKGVHHAIRNYSCPDMYHHERHEIRCHRGGFQTRVGILGVGRVGSRVAKLLQQHDLQVYGCDPFLPPSKARMLGITMVEQEDLFRSCDIVSCHLPTKMNLRGAVGYNEISSMHEYATFINAAQCDVVDQDGLIRALQECPTKTAILDSTDPMPLPENHPLLTMRNVFVTPHIAGSMGNEMERMGLAVVDACSDYLSGRLSQFEVSREKYFTHDLDDGGGFPT